jgi:hypothetical protein
LHREVYNWAVVNGAPVTEALTVLELMMTRTFIS